jgi:hypothetical protein
MGKTERNQAQIMNAQVYRQIDDHQTKMAKKNGGRSPRRFSVALVISFRTASDAGWRRSPPAYRLLG